MKIKAHPMAFKNSSQWLWKCSLYFNGTGNLVLRLEGSLGAIFSSFEKELKINKLISFGVQTCAQLLQYSLKGI